MKKERRWYKIDEIVPPLQYDSDRRQADFSRRNR